MMNYARNLPEQVSSVAQSRRPPELPLKGNWHEFWLGHRTLRRNLTAALRRASRTARTPPLVTRLWPLLPLLLQQTAENWLRTVVKTWTLATVLVSTLQMRRRSWQRAPRASRKSVTLRTEQKHLQSRHKHLQPFIMGYVHRGMMFWQDQVSFFFSFKCWILNYLWLTKSIFGIAQID